MLRSSPRLNPVLTLLLCRNCSSNRPATCKQHARANNRLDSLCRTNQVKDRKHPTQVNTSLSLFQILLFVCCQAIAPFPPLFIYSNMTKAPCNTCCICILIFKIYPQIFRVLFNHLHPSINAREYAHGKKIETTRI